MDAVAGIVEVFCWAVIGVTCLIVIGVFAVFVKILLDNLKLPR